MQSQRTESLVKDKQWAITRGTIFYPPLINSRSSVLYGVISNLCVNRSFTRVAVDVLMCFLSLNLVQILHFVYIRFQEEETATRLKKKKENLEFTVTGFVHLELQNQTCNSVSKHKRKQSRTISHLNILQLFSEWSRLTPTVRRPFT